MLDTIQQLVMTLGEQLTSRKWRCVTAESCTGGGLSYWITTVPGSSLWFERGFITYSNLSKEELLDVSHQTLLNHGSVSEETAKEMALGALRHAEAEISVAITGIAGPLGGSLEKPVGTVWIASAQASALTATCYHFDGDRQRIREKAIAASLEYILKCLPV